METNPRLQRRLRLFSIAGFLFASIVGATSGMGLTFSLMAAFWACYSAAAWIKHQRSTVGRQPAN